MHRLRSLSFRLQHLRLYIYQNKYFKRHCATMIKYNVTLRELRSEVRD